MVQAAVLDGELLDLLPPLDDGGVPAEVDVGGGRPFDPHLREGWIKDGNETTSAGNRAFEFSMRKFQRP